MEQEDVLNLDTRRRIHDFLKAHPGVHLREIARSLELPLGTAIYHLDCMERGKVVVTRRDGRYKRFFPHEGMGRVEKDYVSAFRHRVPRRIAEALLVSSARSQRDLCRAIGVSRSTLSFHVNRLCREGIVSCREDWPENRYELVDEALARKSLGRLEPTSRWEIPAGLFERPGQGDGIASAL